MIANKEDGRVLSYGIAFWRKADSWYDEKRYNSHHTHKGIMEMRPDIHIKLQSSFKDPPVALDQKLSTEEIDELISQYLLTHGPLPKFLEGYDCDVNDLDDYFIFLDWQNLIGERERRRGGKLMEERDVTLIEKLARENEEFRRLLEQHQSLEKDLQEYEKKPYLTSEQLLEKTRLKKLKLAGKDRMEAILRRYRSEGR